MRSPGIVILAAGGSSRMGRPKQLLPWGKSTLLHHACETALATSLRPVVVVLGNEAVTCGSLLEGLDIIPVINSEWQKGMGTSVAVGISELVRKTPSIDGALIMLADQPMISAGLLNDLVAAWSPPDWPIAATFYGDSAGVPSLFDRAFFPELLALDNEKGARMLIARETKRTRLVDPSDDLIDIDTPEIYRAASNAVGLSLVDQ